MWPDRPSRTILCLFYCIINLQNIKYERCCVINCRNFSASSKPAFLGAGLFEFFHYYSFVGVLLSGILRDKTMAYNLMYIPRDDTQNYPLGVD